MKKCSYCGKEYPDEAVRCLIDGEPLLGGAFEPSPVPQAIAVSISPPQIVAAESAISPPSAPWTDRQLLTLEVVLVCLIAFGGSILSSFYSLSSLSGNGSGTSSGGIFKWVYAIMRQGSALGLFWYVLVRRGKSFFDLGLVWARKDFVWSIALSFGGSLASRAVYNAIYYSGLTTVSHSAANTHVGHILFGGGISLVTILFQFVNPFFEELIVRAYVMTEVKHLTNSAMKAIIVSTVMQTSYHFYQGAPAAFGHGATFLIWSFYYAKTNRIAPVILAHLYSDVGSTLWYLFRQ